MTISPKARARLTVGLCVGLSVALHMGALGLALRSAPPRVAAGVPAPESLQGRLVFADLHPVAQVAKALPDRTGTATPTRSRSASDSPPMARPAVRAQPQQSASPAPTLAPAPANGDTDGYLPRSLLSVAPTLITTVTIPEPPHSLGDQLGARVGVVAIYIDEEGRVRDVQAQQPRLPPELEEIVRQSFMAARYVPGQRDGRAARSMIRVEVVFQGRDGGRP